MSRLVVAFVGQCHTVGYPGVPPDAAFPEVCRGVLQASRPGHQVGIIVEPYYHPAQLSGAVRSVLRERPRAVVVEVVGWLAITGTSAVDLSRLPGGVRSAYQRAQFLRRASRFVADKTGGVELVHRVHTSALALAHSVLAPLLPRYPRATVADYEGCVADALTLIRQTPGVTPVVQGPGAATFAVEAKGLASDAVSRYRAVNEMARRVATAHAALYVDRWDTVAGDFYLPGTSRPGRQGHSVWGHLLADRLLQSGAV
jgi:hypothetical protein